MFYVISGYCGPDHYNSESGPVLELNTYETASEVERAHEKFREEAYGKDKDLQVFRVVEGRELKLKEVKTVTKWKLTE